MRLLCLLGFHARRLRWCAGKRPLWHFGYFDEVCDRCHTARRVDLCCA